MAPLLPISVCMIVRDEEKNLAGAIESVLAYVTEVIVVDTGSLDSTVQIALSLGAKVVHFPWQDDFSLARNKAIQAAKCDWILTLDADQRLDQNSLPSLASALENPYLAQIVRIKLMAHEADYEGLSSLNSLRLFRRDQRIQYRGRVHEDISESLLEIGSHDWPDSGVVLRDFGYINSADRQSKRDRNLTLLERAQIEHPDDLYVAYKLALSLPPSRQDERRLTLCEAIKKAGALSIADIRGLPFMPRLLAATVEACVEQGHLCEAAQISQSMLPALGFSTLFTVGRAMARIGSISLASELLIQFLQIGSHHPNSSTQPDPDANKAEACQWLAWLSYLTGNMSQAREWLDQGLITSSPTQKFALECEIIRVNLAEGNLNEVSGHLQRLYPLAQSTPTSYSELMLISAELSHTVGDDAGALQLAQAALTSKDERAAALLAKLELNTGNLSQERLSQLLKAIPGRRFDTLAVRVILARHLGLSPEFELPEETQKQLKLMAIAAEDPMIL